MSATSLAPFRPPVHARPIIVLTGLLVLLSLLVMTLSRPAAPPIPEWEQPLPLAFVPNAGQSAPDVRYQAQGMGGTVFFTPDGVMLSLPTSESESYAVRLRFEGSNPGASLGAASPLKGEVSYLTGNDPSGWRAGVPTYGSIQYEALYPGIDLRYDGVDGRLKGTYLVATGANPADIHWRYEGASTLAVEQGSGALLVALPGEAGTVREEAPVAWQDIGGARVPVAVRYDIAADGSIGFVFPNGYDRAHALTVDPTIAYTRRIWGTVGDSGRAVAVDSSGAIYITGQTNSGNYPGTAGVVQTHNGGGTDAFVTKLSGDGITVLYSTYLGGIGNDIGRDIAVDGAGNVYAAGYTHSANFPTTPGAFQTTRNGYADAFVVKLNPTGTAFAYATYLGGTNYEGGNPTIDLGNISIAIDPLGRAYVTGKTWSGTSFPTQNPLFATSAGGDDAFISVLEPDGAALYFSTYFGGGVTEGGRGIALDGEGMIYVVGETTSSYGLPVVNALQPAYGGGYADHFIAKIDPVTPEIIYSTYLGGTSTDVPVDVVVDALGQATVVGGTFSTDFPTRFPIQEDAGDFDITFSQLSADGSSLRFSTYLGGNKRDEAAALALDPQGYFYIVGSTTSIDFPVVNPVQTTRGGEYDSSDAVAIRLFPGGSVDYATYLGGASSDYGWGIVADSAQSAYVVGTTRSADFPPGAPPPGNTWDDVFAIKLEGGPGPTPTVTSTATSTATATETSTPTPTVTGTPPTATPTIACDTTTVASTDVPKTIGDVRTTTSTLTFPAGPPIAALEVVNLTLSHTFPADLDVDLISPAGTRIVLFHDVCSAADWTEANTGFGLDDGAASAIGTTCPPGQATYRPAEPLAALIGEAPEGTWTLEVTDDAPNDTGTLHGWGIKSSSASCVSPTPQGTGTATPRPSVTATRTLTPTKTPTVTLTPTVTRTPFVTRTPTPGAATITPAASVTTTPEGTPEATPTEAPTMMLDPAAITLTQDAGQSSEHSTMLYNLMAAPMSWTATEAGAACSTPGTIPWLSVSPASGTIAPSSESMLMVTIDTMGMPTGTYDALLCITDDADHVMGLPLSLTVGNGVPQLYFPLIIR